jgi:capsular exopolysaccharide synthesis family protein
MRSKELKKIINLDFQVNEAYNTLRSNIQFCGEDIRVIGLTSCIPNEGKSVVSLNLAVSMAEAGKKVMFIDGDLRRSTLIGRCNIDKSVKGFTHYLSGLNTIEEVILQNYLEGLHIIFAGPVPPNPSELLMNQKFSEIIQQFRQIYDYIILDTPPLGSVIDSAIIAKQCDGMIMVIQANQISHRYAKLVKTQLEMTGCNILGVVLNKVKVKKENYNSKYYDKYLEKQ